MSREPPLSRGLALSRPEPRRSRRSAGLAGRSAQGLPDWAIFHDPPSPRRRTSSQRLTLGLVLFAVLTACGRPAVQRGPREVLDAYAQALTEGRVEDAYGYLSEEARKSLPLEAFRRMVVENPEEVREIALALTRPAGPPLLTATVTAPTGETLLLVYEDSEWRVDGSSIDLYSQATPEGALRSFVRAYENRRYDVLMRFVPSQEAAGLDAAKLKKYWEGDQKAEIERIIQALKAALPGTKVELLGDRATMAYGASGTVELLREEGVWKIEDFK